MLKLIVEYFFSCLGWVFYVSAIRLSEKPLCCFFFFLLARRKLRYLFFFILLVRKYLVMYLFFSWLDQTNLLPDYSLM